MALVGEDCYYYFYSSCAKGEKCPFRHSPTARGKEVMCKRWLAGGCAVPGCAFRHMLLQKNRSQIDCWFESQPTGCLKAHCPFKHSKPRLALNNKAAPAIGEASSTVTGDVPSTITYDAASAFTGDAPSQLPDDTASEAHESATVTQIVDKRETKTTGETSQGVTVVLPNDGELIEEQQDLSGLCRGEQALGTQSLNLEEVRKRARLDRFKGQVPLTGIKRSLPEKQATIHGEHEPAAKRHFGTRDRLFSTPTIKSLPAKRLAVSEEHTPAAKRQYGLVDSSTVSEPARRALDTGAGGQDARQQRADVVAVRSFKDIMAEKQAMKGQVGSGTAERKRGLGTVGESKRQAKPLKRFERHAEPVAVTVKQKRVQALTKEEPCQPVPSPDETGVVRVLSFHEIMIQKRKNSGTSTSEDEPKSVQAAVDSTSVVSAADSSSNAVKQSSGTSVSTSDSSGVCLRSTSSKKFSKTSAPKSSRPAVRRLSRESSKLSSGKVPMTKQSASVSNKATTSKDELVKKSASKATGEAKEKPTKLVVTKETETADIMKSPSLSLLGDDVEMDDDEFMRTLKNFDVKGDLLDDDLLLDVEEVL